MILMRRLSSFFVLVFCLLLFSACSECGYLLQCIKGQWDLMSRARPIDEILSQKTEPQSVLDQLAKVVQLREFAINSLDLPDTGSYREYTDLERPYAIWNVVAAPELSLALNQWCFPIAGCVTYRGYFDEDSAQTLATHLSAQGFEVDVYGVKAYSTLNWFDDPVLNTFLDNDDLRFAALLFHEMSHQVVYIQNDTVFNESFAKTVEIEGLRRWLQSSGSHELWEKSVRREEISADFYKFITSIRDELFLVYTSGLENSRKRLAKQEVLTRAYHDYEQLKTSWDGYEGYDSWMRRGLNNARLSSVATYYDLVPAFRTLLKQTDSDLLKFYAEVKTLGSLPENERREKLKSLTLGRNAVL